MSNHASATATLGQFAARFLEDIETIQEDGDAQIVLTDMAIVAAYDSYDNETGEQTGRASIVLRQNGYNHSIRGLCLAAADLCTSRMKRKS